MSKSETSDISADPIGEGNYFHEEHSISEDHYVQDQSIKLTDSPIESPANIEHINEDSYRREEEEIHLCLSQEETLPEYDSNYETSIMEIQHLLESPSVVDLDPCQVDIESCSSQFVDSNPLTLEPPPHVDNCVNEKNMLSWRDVESYDFLGVDHLLSHDTVQLGTFLLKFISPYYVVIAHLLVGFNTLWGWIVDNTFKLIVGVRLFWWKDPLILNFKKRKK